jgi:FMN-dependent NADH-azoreductase
MRLLNIESSPRGSRSASIAVTSAFLEAYRQACPGVIVDTQERYTEDLQGLPARDDHDASRCYQR